MLTVEFPWPSAELNPNGRVHYMVLARARKKAKELGWGMTRALMGPLGYRVGSFVAPVMVSMTFHPPTATRRDVDNLIASMKGHLDGISGAIGIDDSKFQIAARIGEKRPGGCVRVELTSALIQLENRGVIR